MKRLTMIGYWMVTVLIALVLFPAGLRAEEDDFTFGDVFLQKETEKTVDFHGYAAFQYYDVQGGSGPKNHGSFDQHIFEPFFGYQVNDRVFAKLIFELEHSPEKADAGQYAELFPEQAEIDITFREGTTLAFGAILVPFGMENYLHAPSDNRLISRPPVNKGGKAVVSNTWTDMGIQLTQTIPNVGVFDFYVINGSAAQTKGDRGREDKVASGNHGKSLGAEIQVTQLYPGLNFGASYIAGPHDATNQLDSWRAGVHAQLNWQKRLYLLTEYLMGSDEGLGAATADRDSAGYYVVVSFTPPIASLDDNLDFSARYTDWTFDDDAMDDYSEMAFGIRYEVYPLTWAKVEYQLNSEDGANAEVDNDRVGFQLSVLF